MPSVDYADGTIVPGTRYRVVCAVSTSGMGVVYEVEDVSIGRRFVLKTLHSTLRDEGSLSKRLATEARVLAKLDHPNIVAIVTGGVTDDSLRLPYFVMERLEGQTLRAVLEAKGRLPLAAAYTVGIEVLDALDCAHASSVVHRDVKPENVFLHRSADGTATTKLLDFGVVSVLESTGHDTGERFLGTPRYASPEQCRGEKPTPACDLYAAALVLYEMISGKSPFEGVQGRGAWLEAHAFRAPKALSKLVSVSPALEALVMSGLDKDPARRPPDAFTFAAELRRMKGDPSPYAAPPGGSTMTMRPGEGERRSSSGSMPTMRPTAASPSSGLPSSGLPSSGSMRTVRPAAPSGVVVPGQGLEATVVDACKRARIASRRMGIASRSEKDRALLTFAALLRGETTAILEANAGDVARGREKGLSSAMIDRLVLDETRVEAMAQAVEFIAHSPDPIGEVIAESVRPNGLEVRRQRAPLGVIAMVYESRPNVTADASALCLKAGNAVVLRGGSEAAASNGILGELLQEALEDAGLPADAVQLLPPGERDAVRILVQQTDTVDLAIPRGGEALIRFVAEHARVPVVQHYKGVCHLFVDGGADAAMATAIAVNGKLSRPGVCNALECLLVDASDAARLLPTIAGALLRGGCELRGCERTRALVPEARPATDDDWGHEFLDRILAVKVVDGLAGAMAHVALYGSGHTEAICTPNEAHAERWRREVDAACVVVNASTRFHDGGELGLGAEIGIATSRLHWRGPMGLEALTTMKWVVDGKGQIR